METSIRELFTTESIDLAAYLVCLGYSFNILRPTGGTRALFEFGEVPDLLQAIVNYERGDNGAKRLLNTRSRLYREASETMKKGGAE